jgi:hypothetical protein
MDPKLLTENGWKTIVAKFKIKDNGLQRALATLEKLDENAHDDRLKAIAAISQLANTLKRAKDVAAAAPVVKYLGDVTGAADTQKNDVTKLKAVAMKAQADADKAKAAADKAQLAADEAKAAADKKQSDLQSKDQAAQDKEDEEQGDHKTKLLMGFQKAKVAKDVPYQFLVCDTKPDLGLMIAKRINPAHKQELTKVTGGGKRFLPVGTVEFQDGHFVFNMEKPLPGMARRLQDSVKKHCGKKFPIMCGTERAGAEDEPEAGAAPGAEAGKAKPAAGPGAAVAEAAKTAGGAFSISASVGQGGKNKPEDVQAVQTALNTKSKAGLVVDGKCGPKTIAAIKTFQQGMGKFKPDGLIEVGRATARALAGSAPMGPAPAPPKPVAPPKLGTGTLDKAADTWRSQIDNCRKNCVELEKTIMADCKHEHPTLVKDVQDNFQKVHDLFDKFGTELEETLSKANAAKDAATRNAHLQRCKAILTSHMKYVKSEPLFAHIDRNPWVPTNCTKMLTDCFMNMAQAIGAPK